MEARAIEKVAGVLFPFPIAASQCLRGGLGAAMAVYNLNSQLNALGDFFPVLGNGLTHFLPLRIVVGAGRVLVLRIGLGGVRYHAFITVSLWKRYLHQIRRDVIRITACGGELLAQALHVKFPGHVVAEVDDQSHAAFAALRTVSLFFLLLRGGGNRSWRWRRPVDRRIADVIVIVAAGDGVVRQF